MLRLSHKNLYVGIFDAVGWIGHTSGGKSFAPINIAANISAEEQLRLILENRLGKDKGLLVALSSKYTKCIALPWSENLKKSDEKHAYAEIYFEKNGIELGTHSVMHIEFKYYGMLGFAYAISSHLLNNFRTISNENSLQLLNVMPTDAISYINNISVKKGYGLRFLIEEFRISIMLFSSDGLVQYEMEAGIGGILLALKRLMARIQPSYDKITIVEIWSSKEDTANIKSVIKLVFANASIRVLEPWFWSRYQ